MDKFPPITNVFLFLTNQCCCSCPYCFETRSQEKMDFELALYVTKKLIANAEKSGLLPGITYFGGEPMLEYENIIVPLTNFIRKDYKKPFNLKIITNGVLLDEDRIKFLADNDVNIQLSIDGNRETQNVNRPLKSGQGSFDRMQQVIPLLTKYTNNTYFRATVIPATAHFLYNDLTYLEGVGLPGGFIMPNEFEPWSNEAKRTVEIEIRKYTDLKIKEFKEGKKPILIRNYRDALRQIPRINAAIKNDLMRPQGLCGLKTKCGLCSSNNAAIACNGDIYSCLGEVGEELFKLGSVYTGLDEEKRLALHSLYKNDGINMEKCENCKLNRICDYGCISKNYILTGDLNHQSDLTCWWTLLLLEEAIYMCNGFGDQIPSGFIACWEEINNGK